MALRRRARRSCGHGPPSYSADDLQLSSLSRLSMLVAAMVALAALVAPEANALGSGPRPSGRTFVVYAFIEGNDVYIGRASREGSRSFVSVMSRRYSGGIRSGWNSRPREVWRQHYSGNVPARSGPAYQEARQQEQRAMDRYRASGHNLTNRVRAIAKPKPAPKPTTRPTTTPRPTTSRPRPTPSTPGNTGGQRLCPPVTLPNMPPC